MGFLCFECGLIVPGGVTKLLSHLHVAHALYDMKGLQLLCKQGGCPRTFPSFNSYRKHLVKQHNEQSDGDIPYLCQQESAQSCSRVDSSEEPDNSASDGDMLDQQEVAQSFDMDDVDMLSRHVASFLANVLSDTNMTFASLNKIVAGVDVLLSEVLRSVREDIRQFIEHQGVDLNSDQTSQFLEKISSAGSLFSDLKTRYKQEKLLKEHFPVVHPKPYLLGHRYDTVIDSATGQSKVNVVRETFHYVPLLDTIGMILSNPLLRSEVENGHFSSDAFMRDFCDSSGYQQHPLFGRVKTALQINLFFDEVEVVNPLGSKAGIHKIGAFYFVLRNLEPMFNSLLSNIHILALVNCLDLKKYGFELVLAPFVEEMRKLESEEGVNLSLSDGTVMNVRGSLAMVSADNLGANALFGFVESFSANKPCRVCTGAKVDFQNKYLENDFELRSPEEHDAHVQNVERNLDSTGNTGVKQSCILNTLRYFHVTRNFCPDIMHDVLEGIAPMETKLILKQFVLEQELFTLDQFNQRLASHDFGFADKKNRPSPIMIHTLRSHDYSLKQRASQMWCLLRCLPLLIGEFVPTNDSYWQLFLKLRLIVDIVFAPKVTDGQCAYLASVIEDHHATFKELFPDVNLIPKHHFLVHYPNMIRKVGPLINSWCMRFEAKHMFAKRLSSAVCCFKDICKTVITRHQISNSFFSSRNFNKYGDVGEAHPVGIKEIFGYEEILNRVPGYSSNDYIHIAKSVTFHGTEYRPGMTVVVGHAMELPVFSEITAVLVAGGSAVFLHGHQLITNHFEEHLHAYAVSHTTNYCTTAILSLADSKPLHINRLKQSNQLYVSLRYEV